MNDSGNVVDTVQDISKDMFDYLKRGVKEGEVICTINLGDHIGLVDVVKGTGSESHDCKRCMFGPTFCKGNRDYKTAINLTGIDCEEERCYFVKHIEPVVETTTWIQCTPDNIQVGDEVRAPWNYGDESMNSRVVFIYKNKEMFIERFDDGSEGDRCLVIDYEKKVIVPDGVSSVTIKSFAEMKVGERGVIIKAHEGSSCIGNEVEKVTLLGSEWVIDHTDGGGWFGLDKFEFKVKINQD